MTKRITGAATVVAVLAFSYLTPAVNAQGLNLRDSGARPPREGDRGNPPAGEGEQNGDEEKPPANGSSQNCLQIRRRALTNCEEQLLRMNPNFKRFTGNCGASGSSNGGGDNETPADNGKADSLSDVLRKTLRNLLSAGASASQGTNVGLILGILDALLPESAAEDDLNALLTREERVALAERLADVQAQHAAAQANLEAEAVRIQAITELRLEMLQADQESVEKAFEDARLQAAINAMESRLERIADEQKERQAELERLDE